MYKQYDGYPSGHGAALYKFLRDCRITNGISGEAKIGKTANGMGCLAAQVVAHFKDAVGDIYLHPAGTRDCGEEFIYVLHPSKKDASVLWLEVTDTDDKTLYDGPISAFKAK